MPVFLAVNMKQGIAFQLCDSLQFAEIRQLAVNMKQGIAFQPAISQILSLVTVNVPPRL